VEARPRARFHEILLEGLESEREEETDRRESPQLGRNAGTGRLVSSSPSTLVLEEEITAHVKERAVAGKCTETLGRNDLSQRGDVLTNLAIIVFVGQIPGFTQLGGLGHKHLDDLHPEKLKASIARLFQNRRRWRCGNSMSRVEWVCEWGFERRQK
jgi:hypothetical protein